MSGVVVIRGVAFSASDFLYARVDEKRVAIVLRDQPAGHYLSVPIENEEEANGVLKSIRDQIR